MTFAITRRGLGRVALAASLVVACAPGLALAQAAAATKAFVDSSGRTVQVPAVINRVVVAGPPAQVAIYTLAPEKLAGWVQAPTMPAMAFINEKYRGLPTVGRLTGQGNTANVEAVLAAKPDIIIDMGTIDDTYK